LREEAKERMQVMSGSKGQEIVYTWARLNTPTHKELSDTIDAALRRAKAEVVREIVRGLKNKRIDFEQKLSVTRSSFMQDEYEANIELLSELITEADARAAQIEEGE
jgi:FixJ family two-component response regulator